MTSNAIYQSFDNGQSFAPAYGGYSMLMALDGELVPEPTGLVTGAIVFTTICRRKTHRRRGGELAFVAE